MTAETNKEFIQRFVEEIYIRRELTKYANFVSDEILAFTFEHIQQFFTAFTDAQVNVLELFGEGEKVLARLEIQATNTGPFAGYPPTGKRVTFESYRIYRIVDGKIVGSWAMQDRLGLMEQLGLVQFASTDVNWGSTEEDQVSSQ